MKFAVTPKAQTMTKAASKKISVESLYLANMMVQEAWQNVVDTGIKCEELFDIVDNIAQVTNAVNKHGIKGLEVLGTMTEGSLEAFIGAEAMASAKIAEASLENKFTDAAKNAWIAIKEWFARFYDWIRKMFFTIDAELKHLEGMVAPENDKNFNPNTLYEDPVPNKEAFMALLRSINVLSGFAEKVIPEMIRLWGTVDSTLPMNATGAQIDHGFENPIVEDAEKKLDKLFELVKQTDTVCQNDPFLNKLYNSIKESSSADIFDIAQMLHVNYIRSGKASELGYKTGADIRQVVTEFTVAVHNSERVLPLIQKTTTIIQSLMNKMTNASVEQGTPEDLIKAARVCIEWFNRFASMNTKLNRWIILQVTRAVRRMYTPDKAGAATTTATAA